MKRRWMLAVGWLLLAAITVLSLIPTASPDLGLPNQDKWHHLLAYGVLMFWFCLCFPLTRQRIRLYAVFFLISGLLELIQALLPYRQGEWFDLAANGVGLILGWLVGQLVFNNLALLSSRKR